MKSRHFLAVSGLALSAFLIAVPASAQSNHVDANGMPTDHSTPAEQAQTANLNAQVTQSNGEISAQDNNNQAKYQIQQQQYQEQLQQNQAAQQNYQDQRAAYHDQTAQYEPLRDRYRAERAAYHRYEWPSRFAEWRLKNDGSLLNARVQLINGDRVGNVTAVARAPDGVIEGLEVELDGGKIVWIDSTDARFDRVNGEIITDLYASDLRHMADERIG
jgi:multidrug efflux pump subunit AcrA (membrane-fusion protein)